MSRTSTLHMAGVGSDALEALLHAQAVAFQHLDEVAVQEQQPAGQAVLAVAVVGDADDVEAVAHPPPPGRPG